MDWLALEDDDEDEEHHDENIEPNDRVRDAAKDWRRVKDAYEEEAHRELSGRDVNDIQHLIGEEGDQNPGDVGERDLPCVKPEPEIVYPP